MKKYYLLALLIGAVSLAGCSQEPAEVEEVVIEQEIINLVQEPVIEEVKEVCIEETIEAYNGKIDMNKALFVENLEDYSKAIITAKFTDHFVNNYRYEDSDKFFFGLKVYVGNHTDNGGYYNVLRARTNGLANRNYLTGLVPAVELKDGFTWTIPLNEEIYIANKEFVEGRQFVKTSLSQYKGDRIGAYLSATKELAGWELADINIKVCK